MWSLGLFLVTFVIGGMTGMLLAVPPADFELHTASSSLAHFHNGYHQRRGVRGLRRRRFTGSEGLRFRLHGGWGKAVFWWHARRFYVTFFPLYVAGLLGHDAAGLQHYDVAEWRLGFWRRPSGSSFPASECFARSFSSSSAFAPRRARDETGDPWDGRSPRMGDRLAPPAFNFAFLPTSRGEEPYWAMKQRAIETQHLPRLANISDHKCRKTAPPAS